MTISHFKIAFTLTSRMHPVKRGVHSTLCRRNETGRQRRVKSFNFAPAFVRVSEGRRESCKNGFTLIELLVVIAIIAVLAVVVVLTLNPAGLLQEARDSNRISDMAILKSAISLYLADISAPSLGASGNCYVSINTSSFSIPGPTSSTATATSSCGTWFQTASTTVVTSTPNRSVAGTSGWIPVNVSQISAGAVFPQWPIDPVNKNTYFYSYAASSTGNVFKLGSFMESKKYAASGTADVTSVDGGIDNFVFEQGSNLTL